MVAVSNLVFYSVFNLGGDRSDKKKQQLMCLLITQLSDADDVFKFV